MEYLGKKIEELRKTAGVTQEDLASALDVSRQTIYRWEAGIRQPNVKQIKALCDYFNIAPNDFFSDSTNDETAVSVCSTENLPKEKHRLLNLGTVISVILFLFCSISLAVICYYTFRATKGFGGVVIIEGVWLLITLAVISVISLACIVLFSVLKKCKCNRLGTKMLQTNAKGYDKIK